MTPFFWFLDLTGRRTTSTVIKSSTDDWESFCDTLCIWQTIRILMLVAMEFYLQLILILVLMAIGSLNWILRLVDSVEGVEFCPPSPWQPRWCYGSSLDANLCTSGQTARHNDSLCLMDVTHNFPHPLHLYGTHKILRNMRNFYKLCPVRESIFPGFKIAFNNKVIFSPWNKFEISECFLYWVSNEPIHH